MQYEDKPLSLEELLAQGYHRISWKYHIAVRIDRDDWLIVLATHLKRSVAELYIPCTDTVSSHWPGYYMRCLSKDSIEGIPHEIYRHLPPAY